MILHDFALSSACYRVRIALNLKNLQYEHRKWPLRSGSHHSPEYLSINPAGLLPTLDIDGLRLTQSISIIEYLDTRWPEPALIPKNPEQRANVMAMTLSIACDIHPVNNLRVLQYLEHELGLDKVAVNAWYATWIHAGFAGLEKLLAATAKGPYVTGNLPGIADVCIVPQVYNARRYNVDLGAYPSICRIDEHARKHPAFAAAEPKLS